MLACWANNESSLRGPRTQKFPPLNQELRKGDRREGKGGVERVEGGGDWGMGGRAGGGGGGGGTL